MAIGGVWIVAGLAYLIGLPVGAIVAFFRPPRGRRAIGLMKYGVLVATVAAISRWVPLLHAITWRPVGFTVTLLFGGASEGG